MGIEYYAFALFLSGLICLIAILCKLLFSNVKRERKLLDEKETKLLQLYQTVESIMENFDDQVKAAMEEINEYEIRAAQRAAAQRADAIAQRADARVMAQEAAAAAAELARPEYFERLPRSENGDPGRMKAARDALARAERIVKRDTLKSNVESASSDNGNVFQRLFDETLAEAPVSVVEYSPGAAESPGIQARGEAILALADEGKTDAEIARELGITQNEVKLVKGLTVR